MTHVNRKQLDYTTLVLELRLGIARNVTSNLAVCSAADDNHLEDALAQFLNDDPNEQLWVKVSERTRVPRFQRPGAAHVMCVHIAWVHFPKQVLKSYCNMLRLCSARVSFTYFFVKPRTDRRGVAWEDSRAGASQIHQTRGTIYSAKA